ncbi:MAG TPA: beta-propeller domain-containing protein [Solimonas sp.]|nr:beta-propeller domain-containing protein [Solimonas sp.]
MRAPTPFRRLTALVLLATLAACGSSSNDNDVPDALASLRTPQGKLVLKNFAADCSDFLSYAADALTEQYLNQFACFADGPCPVYAATPGAPPGEATGSPAAGGDNAGPGRVSQTNTQEAGVDEADIVKAGADGRVFVLSGRTLSVVDAFPPQGLGDRPVQTLDLGGDRQNFYASDFFLDEAAGRLAVMGSDYDGGTSGQAVNVLVDVTGAAPVEVGRLSLDGYSLGARRIGARVHRVSRFDVPAPAWFYDGGDPLVQKRNEYNDARSRGDTAAADRIKGEIRTTIGQRVSDQGADFFLPRVRTALAGSPAVETHLACAAIAHPEVTTGLGLAVVDSFNTVGSGRAVAGVVNNGFMLYVSAQNFYLAQSSFGWFFAPQQAEETAIYRLALSAADGVSFGGVGKVDGSVIGPYAFSEHEGFLRVASTESRFESDRRQTYNHVSVLRASDMSAFGPGLRDLAPGEQIRGVRFLGDRGFLVTFRQVDPLFALDLANPGAPRIADVLKLPGFSSYLTPVGEDFLLTVGRAGDEERLNGQVAIQLFDVRDMNHIQTLASISPAAGDQGYSYSTAEYDPHAFSYFSDSATAASPGTLSIPLQTYGDQPSEQFAGFLVVRVDPQAAQPLRETGRIAHEGFADGQQFCDGGGGPGTGPQRCYNAYQAAEPRRSVFMQDDAGTYLYTISALGMLANDAAEPHAELGRVALPYDQPQCCFAQPGGVATGP